MMYRSMRPARIPPIAVAAVAIAAPAYALEQPNGAIIPADMGCDGGRPTGLPAVFACECDVPGVCNIGEPCPAPGQCPDGVSATCETTLWHEFNDNTCIPSHMSGLHFRDDAATTPETFQPTCPLTFTVVSRGTAIFGDAFGWYNVTGDRPDPDDLHVMLDCDDPPGTQVVLDVRADPAYAGGDIGFFLVTPEAGGACANGDCCATVARARAGEGYIYYSERAFNPDAAGADSFIHLLVYDSRVTPRKFYFAWEDIFGGSNNDFTDLVTSVQGVECAGGGRACDTGQPGVCAFGVTECSGGVLDCRALYPPGVEVCDGLDNDCDGAVDDDATCPNADEVCDNGRCLPNCEIVHEFDCPPGTVCDATTGRCHDPACAGVTCPADEVCRDGDCVAPCDGIQCPAGTTCRFGACVDPCAGVTCAAGEVCREGICFPDCTRCDGVLCDGDLACAADTGECVDPSCPAGCPPGTVCDDGNCVDACEGAVCPAGQTCIDGACRDDSGGGGGGSGGGGDGGGSGGGGDGGGAPAGGCGCAKATPDPPAAALLVLFGLRRRRR
ncbi:MAG: DUF4114 domain-containing protein [Deltaproteobacteria bacterium]|nr:MAG: DUF4114 domain-containing protein [Deltaproteobacteria bacterium]